MPSFNFEALERTSRPGGKFVLMVRNIEIMDAYCDKCGFDWQRTLQRIDPESSSAELIGAKPELRFNSLCDSEDCLELGIRGFFRNGHCTGGICTACKRIIAPVNIGGQYVERRDRLYKAITDLAAYTKTLQKMGEAYEPEVTPIIWESFDTKEDEK
jgi:hypothetical protein